LILFASLFAVLDEDHPSHKSQQIRWKPTNHEIPRTNERTNKRKNEPNLKGQSPCLPDAGPDEGILRCASPASIKFP
jgi:hypothetical protein